MTVVAGLAAVVVAVVTLAGQALWAPQSPAAPSPFGGSVAVHVAHVGQIEVDLEPARASDLRPIVCNGATVGTTCFVAPAGRVGKLLAQIPVTAGETSIAMTQGS